MQVAMPSMLMRDQEQLSKSKKEFWTNNIEFYPLVKIMIICSIDCKMLLLPGFLCLWAKEFNQILRKFNSILNRLSHYIMVMKAIEIAHFHVSDHKKTNE